MDNGYKEWLDNKKEINKKRIKLLRRTLPIILVILLIVFFFGYDEELFSQNKFVEFVPGACGIILLCLVIIYLIYPVRKFIPKCNRCGIKIKSIPRDCEIASIKYVGTIDKIEYQRKRKTIKGKTRYPRGGYSMRVSEYEYTSEATYEVEEEIPIKVKYYQYEISYACKNCHEVFKTELVTSKTKMKERK